MENHPIPQDVTGFKFKLIGSITVKQFLYLLGFGILTTVVFILDANLLVKIPFMALFAGIGFSLAFVPIEGRPMDIMIVNFAKAIPSENRYIYRKRGANILSFEYLKKQENKKAPAKSAAKTHTTEVTSQTQKKDILLKRLSSSSFKPDAEETKVLNNIKTFFEDGKTPVQKLPDKMPNDNPPPPNTTISPDNIIMYEAETIKSDESPKNPAPRPEQSAKSVTPNSTLAAGFPTLPDHPNIILGIVKDPRGKTLPNILVEVVDENDIPVRAFKTNALGQFASATSLANGKYKVYFEDPSKQHEFGSLEITLTGDIFTPLEIASTDAREKLRQELFGNANQAVA